MNFPQVLRIAESEAIQSVAGLMPLFSKNHPDKKLYTSFLSDRYRLQEVFEMRLEAWEHTGNHEFVNRELFPHGWFDDLDATALHWITTNERQKIVAAARLNIFNTLEEFPYSAAVQHLTFPTVAPFAFFSRLVVSPAYRNNGLSRELYLRRAAYCKMRGVAWSQVFINNPVVIRLFESEGFSPVGRADISYHTATPPHPVNVFVKALLPGTVNH